MNSSKNPTQKFINRASMRAALADPTADIDQFEYGVDAQSEELFKKELEALKKWNNNGDGTRKNTIVLPPNTVFGLTKTKWSKTLHCAGYKVRTL